MSDHPINRRFQILLISETEYKGRGEQFEDVLSCIFVRSPTFYNSFCIIRLYFTPIFAKQLISDLLRSNTKTFKLKIKEHPEKDANEEDIDNFLTIFEKPYYCTSCTPLKRNVETGQFQKVEIDMVESNCLVELLLINPIFYSLNTKNQFNFRLRNIPAYDALKTFENKINSEFGDCFEINHEFKEENLSNYEYEEILTCTQSSIHIPNYLLYITKPFLTPYTFYLFDDFCLDDRFEKPIVNHLINIWDIDEFPLFDVTKFLDPLYTTTRCKIDEVNHIDNKFISNHIVFKSNKLIADNKLSSEDIHGKTGFKLVNEKTSNIDKQTIYFDGIESSERPSANISFDFSKSEAKDENIKTIIINIADTRENEKLRIKNYLHFINSRLRQFVTFQTLDCGPDWLQFGKRYNLSIDDSAQYLYTPYSIYNVFYKDGSQTHLNHMVQYKMAEFYPDEIKPFLCETCDHNYGMYCMYDQKPVADDFSCEHHTGLT